MGATTQWVVARKAPCSRRVLIAEVMVGDTGIELAKQPSGLFRGRRCDRTRGHVFDRLFCGRYWDRTSDLFRVREARYRCANRPKLYEVVEVATGFEPVWTALQAAASPLGHATVWSLALRLTRADDEIRTRDPHLGKVMRYHCATSARPLRDSSTIPKLDGYSKRHTVWVGHLVWQTLGTGVWRSW